MSSYEGPGPELVNRLYNELRNLAEVKMRRLPLAGRTLQPTALVHEAYMRLVKDPYKIWQERHFYHAAAKAMQHVLLDRAREQMRHRHGGDWHRTDITITLADNEDASMLAAEDILSLDAALHKMSDEYPEQVEIVLLRYFCGMTVAEIARLVGASTRSIERRWRFARSWLYEELTTAPTESSRRAAGSREAPVESHRNAP